MSTLTGVIKAAINLAYYPDIRESDLYADNPHFFLTSGLYPTIFDDSLAPSMVAPAIYRRNASGPDTWEGGLGAGSGGQGWYRFAVANVELNHTDALHGLSISSALSVEAHIQSLKDNIGIYIEMLGYEGAKQAVRNNLINLFAIHPNVVRANSELSYPQSIFSGQPDEGAASFWHLMELPGTVWYVYGVDQIQTYIDPNNWELVDGDIIYHDIGPPADMVFDAPYKQMAWSFLGCEGPAGPEPGPVGPGGYYCPEEYGVNWHIEKIVEVNYDAIVDWIMPPR